MLTRGSTEEGRLGRTLPGQLSRSAWGEREKQPWGGEHRAVLPVAVDTCLELGFNFGGSPQTQKGKEGVTRLDSVGNCPFDNFLVWA